MKKLKIVKKFEYCYINNRLFKILICLKNNQNIILLGNNESGLTQIGVQNIIIILTKKAKN